MASTAWRGGEVVYRYGLGVMSMPQTDDHGHSDDDHKSNEHAESQSMDMDKMTHRDDDDHHDTASAASMISSPDASLKQQPVEVAEKKSGHYDDGHTH